MRSERLLATLLLLQTHQRLSAAEIAARLEVSTRTVMRDVDALSGAGVPVYTERGRHGGIAILPGYTTDVTGLTDEETRSLFVLMTSRVHAELGLGGAMASALRKVMAALPEARRDSAELVSNRVLIDPVRWGRRPARSSAADQMLATVQHAVLGNRRITIGYRPRLQESVRQYLVDPYGLVNKAGTWYLVADHRRRPRLFRLDRIRSAAASIEAAQRRRGIELARLWDELRTQVDHPPGEVLVDVRVRQPAIRRFLLVHGADLVDHPVPSLDDTDTDIDIDTVWDLTVRMRSVGAAQMLLAFGADVVVLAPEEVRVHLQQVIGELAAGYRELGEVRH